MNEPDSISGEVDFGPAGVATILLERIQDEIRATLALTPHPALASELATYLWSGEPASILDEIAALSAQMELRDGKPRLARQLRESNALFALILSAPPEVLVRWGRAVRVISGEGGQRRRFDLAKAPDWIWPLLMDDGDHAEVRASSRPRSSELTMAILEAAMVADRWPASALIEFLLSEPTFISSRLRLTAMPDFESSLLRHLSAIRPLLRPRKFLLQWHVIRVLSTTGPDFLSHVADELVALATCGRAVVRRAVKPLIMQAAASCEPILCQIAERGAAKERLFAFKLLSEIAHQNGKQYLLELVQAIAASDPSRAVIEFSEFLHQTHPVVDAHSEEGRSRSRLMVDWVVVASPELERALAKLWSGLRADAAWAEQQNLSPQAQRSEYSLLSPDSNVLSTAEQFLRAYLFNGKPGAPPHVDVFWRSATLRRALIGVPMTPVALVKVLAFLGMFRDPRWFHEEACEAFEALYVQTGRPSLIELHAIIVAVGGSQDLVTLGVIRRVARSWLQKLRHEDQWPLVRHHLDVIIDMLQQPSRFRGLDLQGLYRLLECLPAHPDRLVNCLWDVAHGERRIDRKLALRFLVRVKGIDGLLVSQLKDRRVIVRQVAANLLGARKYGPAVASLIAAFESEEDDLVRGAMIDALEALGHSLEQIFDRESLLSDSRMGLQANWPAELQWLREVCWPRMVWRDGAPVAEEVLLWLCLRAHHAQSPEPSVFLRTILKMMDRRSAESFGQCVLKAWLHADRTPREPGLVRRRAADEARRKYRQMRAAPRFWVHDPEHHLTLERLTAKYELRHRALGACALDSKGVLAVAAAAGGADVADLVAGYLDEWRDQRVPQGVALVRMLSWVEHPSAEKLLCSVGDRYRVTRWTAVAAKAAEALAERRGWTMEDLADRLVLASGFGEDGTRSLRIGSRRVRVRLKPDTSMEVLRRERPRTGRITAFRPENEEALAAAAMKALLPAKREIKATVALQTTRLRRAMWSGREWPAEDWSSVLLRHPILRLLVQRLVWMEFGPSGVPRSFRPQVDGALVDLQGAPLDLHEGAYVQVAIDYRMDSELARNWQSHFRTWGILPLFPQFGAQEFISDDGGDLSLLA